VLWNLDGESVARLESVGPVQKSRFSPDAHWLATLDRSGRVNLWDSRSGKPMSASIFGPTKIEHIAWHGDRLLIGGNSETKGSHWVSEIKLPKNWQE
jgi:WD40 repeat protein